MSDTFPIPFGRYELTERLAMGGMAELFLGRVTGAHGFEKTVVIKRILPHLAEDEHFTEMFISEAKITAQLSHPKIAQTYELGQIEDQLYIAMEFVDGLDVLAMLRECAHRKKRMPAPLAVFVVSETLDALDFAHKQADSEGQLLGIVHRDISPSNILVSRRGDVKLVDFGIAHKIAQEHHTQAGTLKGKYGYMSPEQVLGENVTGQSDLFSVGVVLSEMLMGRRLFAAPNELDVLLMVRDVDLTRLDKLGKEIDPGLDAIIRKSLHKEPAQRFADAAEFREALDEWLFDNRHRIGPRQVAELVDKLYEPAVARRREQLDKQQPPVRPGEKAEAPDAAPPDESAGEIEGSGSGGEISGIPSGEIPTDQLWAGDSVPIVEIAEEVVPEAIRDEVTAPRQAAAVAAGGAEEGAAEEKPAKWAAKLAIPPGDESVPEPLDDEAELSIRFPSISAAVASLSPKEPDPATRDFDDSDVAGGHKSISGRSERRLPTLEEIAQAPRPSPPALEDIVDTPSESGDLKETSPIKLLCKLATNKASGLLVLSVGGIRKEVYFRDGTPEYVSSNVAGELFGAYLVSQGVVSEGELDMALAMMPHYGGKLGDTLVGLGLLRPLEVFRLLTRQVRQKLIDVCTWEAGLYAWHAERSNRRESFRLDLDPLEVLGAGARALSADFLERWVEGVREQKPRPVPKATVAPADFKVGPEAGEIYRRLDGEKTIAELAKRAGDEGERLKLLQVLYLLVQSGLAASTSS